MVTPWGTHYSHQDAVARLAIAPDGQSASGNFTGPVQFMKVRAQRLPPVIHAEYVTEGVAATDKSFTSITEAQFIGGSFGPQTFAVGLRVRDCWHTVADQRDGARPVWLYGLTDRPWACALFRDGAEAKIWQSGPRRLWDEAEAAYRWWADQGEPDHTRFGLTVTAEGQRVWLDDPSDAWTV